MFGNDELDIEMQVSKDDFVSSRCRPILKAYLGAEFEAAQTYQRIDEHEVKSLNTHENYWYTLFWVQMGIVPWSKVIETLLSLWVEKEIKMMKTGSGQSENFEDI